MALLKGAKWRGVSSEVELKPSFFTFVVSAAATIPSTCVLGLVAKILTIKYLVTRDIRESDVALRKGAKRHGVLSEAELKPSFFTFVISTFATSPSTRVLGLVAKVLTTKVKNEGSVTYV